jgi:PAS domain S-box-containing protein
MVKTEKEKIVEEKAKLYLEKLEEKLNYYKKVVIDSNNAIIIQDFNGIIKAWNKGAKQIYGFSEKEMLGKSVLKIIAPRFRAEAKKNIHLIRQGKPTFKIGQVRRTKDGKEVFLTITYSPIYEKEEVIEVATTEENVSELKKSLKDLAESEKKYRRLFETAQEAIFVLNAHTGKIEDSNLFVQTLLGYSAKELIGKHIWQISPFKNIVANKEKFIELQKQKYVRYENLPLETKSGEKVYVEFISNVHGINGGTIIQCNIRDITERKKTEEILRDSEEKFRSIFEHSSVGVSIVSPGGKWLQVNPALCKMVGYSEKELLSRGYMQLTFKEDVPKTIEFSKGLLFGKKGYGYLEKRYLTKDKKIIWVHLSVSLIRDSKNVPQYFVVHTEDITERKKAEDELKTAKEHFEQLVEQRTAQLSENEEKFRKIFENTVEGFLLISKKMKIIEANNGAEKILGFSKANLIGKTLSEIHSMSDYEKCRSNILKVFSGEKAECDCDYLGKLGKHIFAETKLSPVKLFGKMYVLLSFRDITERKEADEKLRNAYEKLKELDSMKAVFLSMVSHELKTPLTPIKSQLQRVISDGMSKDEINDSLNIVLRNAIRLEKLINDVLETSRIESKRFVLDKIKMNLSDIIRHSVSTISSFAKEKNTKIKLDADDTLFMVGDPYRIEEVMINLLDNAIRHGKPKNIKISVKKLDNIFLVGVKDDGTGVHKEEKENLFKSFYRGKEKERGYAGAGLGLAISRGIITGHGGKIWVESEFGKGATFYFTLPIKAKHLKIKRDSKIKEEGKK